MAATLAEKQKPVVTGKDGKSYEVVSDGRVKRVTSLAEIKKLDVSLDEDYNRMTVRLYRHIKDNVPNEDVTFNKGVVKFRLYKIYYYTGGVKVIDLKHHSKVVETKFVGFPTDEEVLNFIKSLGVYKTLIKKKEDKLRKNEKIPINLLVQRANRLLKGTEELKLQALTNFYHEFKQDKTIFEDVKINLCKRLEDKFPYLKKRDEVDFSALRKKALKMISSTKLITEVVEKMDKAIPHVVFNINYGKLLRRFKVKEIRAPKFREELVALLTEEEVWTPKKIPAPAFLAKNLPEDIETLRVNGDENTVTILHGKSGQDVYGVSEFLLRDLLYYEPRLNVAIAKFLNGELTAEQVIETPVVADRFISLTYAQIKGHREDLQKLATELYAKWEMCPIMYHVFKNESDYKEGDKIRAWDPFICTWYGGKITKHINGWKILWDTGDVDWINKFMKIEKLK